MNHPIDKSISLAYSKGLLYRTGIIVKEYYIASKYKSHQKMQICRKLFIAIFLLIAPFFAALSVTLEAQENTAKDQSAPIKIGAIISLSGGLEQWCEYIKQGMEIAAGEEGEDSVRLIYEDDRSVNHVATVSAARKLIDKDKVDLIYTWTSSVAPVLIPITKKAKLPLFISAYDQTTAEGGDFVFGAFVNYLTTPRDILRFFAARGAKRLALVLAADYWSAGFEAPFRDEARINGLDIVYSETIDPRETEMRTIVANLKKHRVEAVLAPLYGPSLLSFIRRHREARAESLISVGDGMFEGDIKNIGNAAEGVTATQIWLESLELNKKVKERFGGTADPLQLGLIATGYDAIKHFAGAAHALRRDGIAITRDSINAALKGFKSSGYLGELMLGVPQTRSVEEVVVIEHGRYRRVK